MSMPLHLVLLLLLQLRLLTTLLLRLTLNSASFTTLLLHQLLIQFLYMWFGCHLTFNHSLSTAISQVFVTSLKMIFQMYATFAILVLYNGLWQAANVISVIPLNEKNPSLIMTSTLPTFIIMNPQIMMTNSSLPNFISVLKPCSDLENLFGRMHPSCNLITGCPCITLFAWTKNRLLTLYLCLRLINLVKAVRFLFVDPSSTTTASSFSQTIFKVETHTSLTTLNYGCVTMGRFLHSLGLMGGFKQFSSIVVLVVTQCALVEQLLSHWQGSLPN